MLRIRRESKTKAFTLIEIMIVVIIVGVLTSLALPRYGSLIEYSRVLEAFMGISAINRGVEACLLMTDEDYVDCDSFNELIVDDPGLSPGAHFSYQTGITGGNFVITAIRNTFEGGNLGDEVNFTRIIANGLKNWSGTGAFRMIR